MSLRRRIENSRSLTAILGRAMAGWFGLCRRTTRWKVEGRDALRDSATDAPVLYLMWHSRSALGPLDWPEGAGPLSSLHASSPIGRVGGAYQGLAGLHPVEMSHSKGGAAQVKPLMRQLRAGHSLGMVADGPRGPARQVNAATVNWVMRLRRPVWAYAFATARGRRAASWDRQLIPLPLDRGAVVYQRLDFDPEWTAETCRAALSAHLDAATARADTLLGLQPGD